MAWPAGDLGRSVGDKAGRAESRPPTGLGTTSYPRPSGTCTYHLNADGSFEPAGRH